MKKLFALMVIVSFLFGAKAFAWQDPCTVIGNTYTCNGLTFENWIEEGPLFSPAPQCQGIVTLRTSTDAYYYLHYVGNNGVLMLSHVLLLDDMICRVSNKGNLECKIVTQPEESVMVTFGQQE